MTQQSFSEFEHSFWNTAADPYDSGIGPGTSQVVKPLLKAVHLKNGGSLLDIACGPGYIAQEALKLGAKVTGLDFSASMVRLAAQKYPQAEFQEGDAQKLPFPDNGFDAVTCAFGVLHFEEPEKAIAEAFRVCKSGGRYAYSVWNTPERAVMFSILMGSVQKHGQAISLPEGPSFFKFADKSTAIPVLENAGFENVTMEEVSFTWNVKSAAELIAAFHDGGARIGGMLRAQSREALQKIENEIQSEIDKYKEAGVYKIPVSVVICSGKKP